MQENYTIQEAAKILKISPRTVGSLIKRKKLEAFTVGSRHYRIRGAAIDDFIKKNLVTVA